MTEKIETKIVCAVCGKHVSMGLIGAFKQHWNCWFKEVPMTNTEMDEG